MGRNKEFNNEETLKKAINVFWEKGYEHTSLKDLLAEMGILNGSFYHTYGHKKNLFIEALKFYNHDFTNQRLLLFNSQKLTFQQKIRIMFNHVLDRQEAGICPKGCLLFNSVSSETMNDLDIYKLIRSSIDQFENFLEDEILKAIAKNELSQEINPKITATILITYIQGLIKLSVMDYQDIKFRNQTEYFITSIGL